jgi:hypothetical protein
VLFVTGDTFGIGRSGVLRGAEQQLGAGQWAQLVGGNGRLTEHDDRKAGYQDGEKCEPPMHFSISPALISTGIAGCGKEIGLPSRSADQDAQSLLRFRDHTFQPADILPSRRDVGKRSGFLCDLVLYFICGPRPYGAWSSSASIRIGRE